MRPALPRALTALLAAAALLVAGCNDDPLINRIQLPLGFFPCAYLDPATGAWSTHPFPPLPDTPPDLDAGAPPDAGSFACPDAGAAFIPDASPTTCQWMVFDQKSTYIIEHPLGRAPSSILVFISFEPDGRSSSIATGDTMLVRQSCARSVTIRNDTNQRFYARVVLE